jgi:GxxExxY protein
VLPSFKGDIGMEGDMEMAQAEINRLTERIIQCIIRVHQILGPGFLEKIYQRALVIELGKQGLLTEVEKSVPVCYSGYEVGRHQLDLLVQGQVIVELKNVEALSKAHYAQVRSYLKATNLNVALLVNFSNQRADFRRIKRA